MTFDEAFTLPARLRQELEKIIHGDTTLIAGPWLSELGYEVMYWIPFLNWIQQEFNVPRDRMIAISRGGVELWYRDLVCRYFEIFEHYSVEEFRQKNEARAARTGLQKQIRIDSFDQEVIEKIKPQLPDGDYQLLHPSLMYNWFLPFWNGFRGIELVRNHSVYRPFPHDDAAAQKLELPDEFVAVKFYTNGNLPNTVENREKLNEIIQRISGRYPIVLLDHAMHLDDHGQFRQALDGRVISAAEWMQPANNLAVQSHILSRATAFVGTYGGFASLSGFYGCPTLALYSNTNPFFDVHLALTQVVFAEFGPAPFLIAGMRDLKMLDLLHARQEVATNLTDSIQNIE